MVVGVVREEAPWCTWVWLIECWLLVFFSTGLISSGLVAGSPGKCTVDPDVVISLNGFNVDVGIDFSEDL